MIGQLYWPKVRILLSRQSPPPLFFNMENFTKEASVDSAYNATNLDVSPDHSEQTSESDCHETPPADLIRSGTSFAESESNDTEEEHHVRHSLAFTGDFDSFNPIATADKVRIKALSDVGSSPVKSEEESDYEEPRKMNGTPSSSLGDTEIRVEHDGAEEAILAPTTGDVPLEESAEREACDKCLKCGELINSDEKVNTACPHFHVNCFRCAQCDCRITSDFLLVNGAPYCKNHSAFLSSGDTAKEVNLSVTKQDDGEVSFDASSRPPGLENRNVQDSHRGSPPPSDDILPPTGSAKRLVEQWSNIETLKANQNFTNTALSDSPQYAPNTAKTIAAKFSAGTTDDQQSPRPKVSMEPTEQWPSQGQARGLIAKFSAMHS
uniref:Zinc finger LIM type n=1 Tax=Echinococcus granulosus TaxID=6210 RepID=A0A068WBC2_ECHGR|nr:Zinc finger LIM type [Echinococcus granulosus]